jgi:hypothetical protein
MSKRNRVWVVEMWLGRWIPTMRIELDQEGGHRILAELQACHPNEKYRLTKYVAEGKP